MTEIPTRTLAALEDVWQGIIPLGLAVVRVDARIVPAETVIDAEGNIKG